jgi:hypothetical protein
MSLPDVDDYNPPSDNATTPEPQSNIIQQPKPRNEVLPPLGGIHGQFNTQIRNNIGHGITTPLYLGKTGRGADVVLDPSKCFNDYVAVDLNAAPVLTKPHPREFNAIDVEKYTKQLLNAVGPKADVKDMKAWEQKTNGILVHAPFCSLSSVYGDEGVHTLSMPFFDNFSVQAKYMPDPDNEGKYLIPCTVVRMLMHSLGFLDGQQGDKDPSRKFYVNTPNKKADENIPLKDQAAPVLVKGADIACKDIIATCSLLQIAQETDEHGNNKIIEDIASGGFTNIYAAVDKLTRMHPHAPIVQRNGRPAAGSRKTDLISAFQLSAQYITLIDMDCTTDIPCTFDIEKGRELMDAAGFDVRNANSTRQIGQNALKTTPKILADGRTVQVLVYNKDIEGFQASGLSHERKVENKLFFTGHASTKHLRDKYAHKSYQERGIGRIEICVRGDWSERQFEEYHQYLQKILEPAMCVHSIHDKAKLIDQRLAGGSVLAVFDPSIYRKKVEIARERHQSAGRESARDKQKYIPHGVACFYVNSMTYNTIGITISGKADGRTNDTGFGEFVSAVATQAPCGLPITFLIPVGNSLDRYLAGENPVVFLRRLHAIKVSVTQEQMLMHIPRQPLVNPGLDVDLAKSCGININEMERLRFAIKNTPLTYAGTGLDLEFQAGDAMQVQIKTNPRPYCNHTTLPANLTAVQATVQPRNAHQDEDDDEDNAPQHACFEYEGTLLRFSGNRESEVCKWIDLQGLGHAMMQVRYSEAQHALQWTFGLNTNLIETDRRLQARDIPVRPAPQHMKILKLQRVRYNARGVAYEAYLENEGKFSLPLTTTKRFVTYLMDEGIADRTRWQHGQTCEDTIMLEHHFFYLGHTESKFGRVKGGSGGEEFVTFFRKAQFSPEFFKITQAEPARNMKRQHNDEA